jgi:ABC-type Zn uptake system ZnuABC Zn-binding protein ZnuA
LHDTEVDLHRSEAVVIRASALGLAVLVAASPCAAFAQQKARVVTTSADLKSLVEAVGGDRIEVDSLAVPEQDPHSIELKPGQLARLRGAALLVRIGLDHEPWLARALSGVKLTTLDASKEIKLLQTATPRLRAERAGHVHAYGNTHYWLNPDNARPITAAILASLVELRPGERPIFEANRAAFLSVLDGKIAEWEKALAPHRGARVVVMHDSWAYFAERFGLQIVAAAEPNPGIPPSPAELAALFKRMRESGVRVLLAEPSANPALVRQIVEKAGARAVTLSTSGFDYIALFEENVKRLSAVLKTE